MMEKCVSVCLFASVQAESIRSGRRPERQLTGLQYLPHTLARQIYEVAGRQFTHPDADRKVSASLRWTHTGRLEEDRFDNVSVFEYMNLTGSAYQFDADRPRYLCRAGWEFPFLACAWV